MSIGVWSIARIMIPEILGPNHVVIGMACMPGEGLKSDLYHESAFADDGCQRSGMPYLNRNTW